MTSTVMIEKVAKLAPDDVRPVSFHIDAPKPGTGTDIHAVEIRGWVVGRSQIATGVEIVSKGQVLRSVPLHQREDVTRLILAANPQLPQTPLSGFRTAVGTIGLPRTFDLVLRAVLQGGDVVPLCEIQGRHGGVPTEAATTIAPLFLVSMGRTGTTWTMRLLSQHPEIVAFQQYPYESRVAQYWAHALKVLSEPANLLQSSSDSTFFVDPFKIGHNPFAIPGGPLFEWNCQWQVAALAEACRTFIDEAYRHAARLDGKERSRYFIEKMVLTNTSQQVFSNIYPNTARIYLIRDLRDVIASVFSFNRKKGVKRFGQNGAVSDEEYVDFIARQGEALMEAWQSTPGTPMVRYEDLITRPHATLAAILKDLGLDHRSEIIDGMIERASRDDANLVFHRTSSSQEASIGRWERDLTGGVQARCAERLGELLRGFGYAA